MDRLQVQVPDLESYWLKQIKCQEACPVRTDARGEFSSSWKILGLLSRRMSPTSRLIFHFATVHASPIFLPQSQVRSFCRLIGFTIVCKPVRKKTTNGPVSSIECGNGVSLSVSEKCGASVIQRGMCFADLHATRFPLRIHHSNANALL